MSVLSNRLVITLFFSRTHSPTRCPCSSCSAPLASSALSDSSLEIPEAQLTLRAELPVPTCSPRRHGTTCTLVRRFPRAAAPCARSLACCCPRAAPPRALPARARRETVARDSEVFFKDYTVHNNSDNHNARTLAPL